MLSNNEEEFDDFKVVERNKGCKIIGFRDRKTQILEKNQTIIEGA